MSHLAKIPFRPFIFLLGMPCAMNQMNTVTPFISYKYYVYGTMICRQVKRLVEYQYLK